MNPWTEAYQAPLSMGFSRPEHWGGLPFPSPADPPDSEIEPGSPALQADSLPPGKATGEAPLYVHNELIFFNNVFVLKIFECLYIYACVTEFKNYKKLRIEDMLSPLSSPSTMQFLYFFLKIPQNCFILKFSKIVFFLFLKEF